MRKLIRYIGIAAISFASLLPLSCLYQLKESQPTQYTNDIKKMRHSFFLSCGDKEYFYNWDLENGWKTNDEHVNYFHVEKYYSDGLNAMKHKNDYYGCKLYFKTNLLEKIVTPKSLYLLSNDNSVTAFYNEEMNKKRP